METHQLDRRKAAPEPLAFLSLSLYLDFVYIVSRLLIYLGWSQYFIRYLPGGREEWYEIPGN